VKLQLSGDITPTYNYSEGYDVCGSSKRGRLCLIDNHTEYEYHFKKKDYPDLEIRDVLCDKCLPDGITEEKSIVQK
jgi:hypothetical protein